MKNIISKIKNLKVWILALILNVLNMNIASADGAGDPANIADAFTHIQPDIEEFIKPISAVLIFTSVVFLGINLVIKANKPDDRSSLMKAFIGIAIGTFILGSVGLIYEFIMTLALN